MPLPKNACTSPFLSHFRIVSVIPTRRLAQIALDVGVFFSPLSNCGHNEPAVGDGSPHYYEGQTGDQGGVIGGNFGMDMVMAQGHWISMFLGIPENPESRPSHRLKVGNLRRTFLLISTHRHHFEFTLG